MSGLVFACIAPHSAMVIPAIGGADGRKALATRAAMAELGRRVAAARPETIVLVTPHGVRVDGTFSLLDTARVVGQLGGDGAVVSVEVRVDNALNEAIVATARRTTPTRACRSTGAQWPLSGSWGARSCPRPASWSPVPTAASTGRASAVRRGGATGRGGARPADRLHRQCRSRSRPRPVRALRLRPRVGGVRRRGGRGGQGR